MPARKRKSLEDVSRVFQQFMYYRGQESTADKEKGKLAKKLRDYCRTHGTVRMDPDTGQPVTGNIEYYLSEPHYIGDKKYTGFELRRQGGKEFDDDVARKLAKDKGIEGDVLTRTITLREKDYQYLMSVLPDVERGVFVDILHTDESTVDQEAFYVAYQKKQITEEEVDSLLVEPENPRYALWPIEGIDDEADDDE